MFRIGTQRCLNVGACLDDQSTVKLRTMVKDYAALSIIANYLLTEKLTTDIANIVSCMTDSAITEFLPHVNSILEGLPDSSAIVNELAEALGSPPSITLSDLAQLLTVQWTVKKTLWPR